MSGLIDRAFVVPLLNRIKVCIPQPSMIPALAAAKGKYALQGRVQTMRQRLFQIIALKRMCHAQ